MALATATFPLSEPIPGPTPPSEGNPLVLFSTYDPAAAVSGLGIIRPFQRDQKNDVATAFGSRLMISKVVQVLGTRASVGEHVGELRWNPDFGCKIWALKHKAMNPGLEALAKTYVREALTKWLPNVRVRSINVSQESPDGNVLNRVILKIDVKFDIVSSQGSLLVPGLTAATVI